MSYDDKFVEKRWQLRADDDREAPPGTDPRLYNFAPTTQILSERRQMELDEIKQNIFVVEPIAVSKFGHC